MVGVLPAATQVVAVPLADIVVPTGRRPVKDVRSLADSIAEIGLLNPITLTEGLTLVAGLHRLRAFELLGRDAIPATVVPLDGLRAELAEIDENLIRSELTVLERGEQLARRKSIYEALHPETKDKVAGGKARHGAATETVSFADDTARKTGVSPRTIQHEVQIATDIAPDVKDAVRGTPAANNKRDLLALARAPEPAQREAVARVARGEARTVREAIDPARRRREELQALRAMLRDATSSQALDAARAAASKLVPPLTELEAADLDEACAESRRRIDAQPAPLPRADRPPPLPDPLAPMAAMFWARRASRVIDGFLREWAELIAARPSSLAGDSDARAAFESEAARLLNAVLDELPDDARQDAAARRPFGVIKGGRQS